MGTSYVRQSSMADGDTITAALFNDEFNRLLTAFSYASSSTTGHQHDGTAAEGGNIHTIGDQDFLNKIVADSTNNRWGFFVEVSSSAVEQIRIQDGAIVPVTDNDIDLGTSSLEFKDAYFDGTVTTDGLTVSGTTNLDGAIQVDNTITVGVDDTGYDVKFFGDTASAYMLWDTSTDDLVLAGAAGIDLAGDLDVDGTANLDAVDIDGAVQIDGTVTVGVDGTGLDVKFFGDTAGSFLLWDQSDDALELTDSTPLKIGDSADMQIYHDGSNSYLTNATGALKLATESSGIAVTIGHTTSETTVADNLTVTGNASIGGNLDVTGSFDMSDADITNIGSIALDTITNDGTDITLDSSGDIILDAGGADIFFKDDGTTFGSATNTSGNLIIKSGTTTALTFSGANVTGAGTYTGGGLMTTGGNVVIPDAGNIGSASDTDAIAISSGGVVTMNQIPVFSAGINVSGGSIAGTLSTAAQGNVTSLGTLTALTVDDVAIDGKVITMTGSSSDTAVITAGTNGTLSIVTTDAAAAAANIQITADGTVDIDSAGVLTLDSGAAINIEPAAGSAILLDGTISIDAGVITGATAITLSGELDAGSLDVSGDADIDGTLEADAITVDGTALNEFIADTVGAMVGSNTESGITVAYQDGDNTLDFTVGTLNQDTTGTAAIATTVTITDNESTNENNAVIFTAGGDLDGGNLGLESDGDLTYNPSTGLLSSTGVTASGTVTFGTLSDGTIGVTAWVDEDDMSSDSATLVPTQQSVKAYVDSTGSGTMSSFILEDDDGTEVSISNAEEVKFIGSGITTNWTDTTPGSDGDPFDLTFTVDAAQTGITSIYATDLIMGEDSQTAIDFGTANEIDFKVDNAARLTLTTGALYPVTDNQIDLGTASLEFKDAFFDGTVTADAFAGPLTGNVTGNASGTALTVTQAAQSAITSLGTLTTLTVDNVIINGSTIGHTGDTDLMTVASGVLTVAGEVSMTTLDIGGTNVTSTAAELNIMDGVTSTAAELNALDGITAVVGELNALDIGATAVGTAVASKAVILDSNKDYTGLRNLTITGELDAATLDISGNVDIDGTLETDNLTVGGAQGSDGQVLTSTGSGVAWEDAGGGGGVGNQAIELETNNGEGSTATGVRKYATTRVNVGDDMTLATDSTNGAVITINTTGIYHLYMRDKANAAGKSFGASLNSGDVTAIVSNLSTAQVIMYSQTQPESGTNTAYLLSVSRTLRLEEDDIVRPQSNTSGGGDGCFMITRVA